MLTVGQIITVSIVTTLVSMLVAIGSNPWLGVAAGATVGYLLSGLIGIAEILKDRLPVK